MNEKELKDVINSYSKLSSDQLMSELIKHMAVQNSKDGGTNMRQTIERIKPLLNAEQRKRLEEILKNVSNTRT
jgi:hypothetical protein